MADITVRNQGEVSEEGKQNWRGDQVAVPQGGQSVYKTSTVQLAQLGSRKVVGDRVFRYALASGGAGAGDLCECVPTSVLGVTAGTVNPAGGKQFTFYLATSSGADEYAEGYLHCQSGTAANMGYMYRIKSHPEGTGDTVLSLYDPLKIASDVIDEWSITKNMYSGIVENTDGTEMCVGVAPILITSGEYFWLQTWGPCALKHSAGANAGIALSPGATGEAYDYVIGTTAKNSAIIVGQSMQVMTASEYGMAFITIAP